MKREIDFRNINNFVIFDTKQARLYSVHTTGSQNPHYQTVLWSITHISTRVSLSNTRYCPREKINPPRDTTWRQYFGNLEFRFRRRLAPSTRLPGDGMAVKWWLRCIFVSTNKISKNAQQACVKAYKNLKLRKD